MGGINASLVKRKVIVVDLDGDEESSLTARQLDAPIAALDGDVGERENKVCPGRDVDDILSASRCVDDRIRPPTSTDGHRRHNGDWEGLSRRGREGTWG